MQETQKRLQLVRESSTLFRRVASAHVTLPALTRRMCRHVRDNLGPVIALIPSNYNRLEVCVFVVHLATTAALEHFTR